MIVGLQNTWISESRGYRAHGGTHSDISQTRQSSAPDAFGMLSEAHRGRFQNEIQGVMATSQGGHRILTKTHHPIQLIALQPEWEPRPTDQENKGAASHKSLGTTGLRVCLDLVFLPDVWVAAVITSIFLVTSDPLSVTLSREEGACHSQYCTCFHRSDQLLQYALP